MVQTNILHSSHPPQAQKAKLVDLGLACLARGEWGMVLDITTIIRARGYQHA
jgi:hypothetical protein